MRKIKELLFYTDDLLDVAEFIGLTILGLFAIGGLCILIIEGIHYVR